MKRLEELRKNELSKFEQVAGLGNLISQLAREENIPELERSVAENAALLPHLRLYIEDAFDSVLALRFNDSIEFFLKHGLNLAELCPESLFLLI
jgi:hypothetical protein